jgi:hypothetical protein
MSNMDCFDAFEGLPWLAVPNVEPEEVIRLLGFHDPEPSSWEEATDALSDDYEALVFVTPRLRGWTYVVGRGLLDFGEGDRGLADKRVYVGVTDLCKRLSRDYGRAGAFGEDGQLTWYFWILARDGDLCRRFVWDDALVVDEGEILPAELTCRKAFEATEYFDPESECPDQDFRTYTSGKAVSAVVSQWMQCPTGLEESELEPGWLAFSPWRTKH